MSDAASTAVGRPPNSLVFLVGEMSGKLDTILSQTLPKLNDLDSRIGTLEVWQGYTKGGFAVIILIFTAWEVIRYVYHL